MFSQGRSMTKEIKLLILLVTDDCNLRCRYCYARGGEKKEYMSTDNLALRVISDTPYRQTMKFTVRLLDQFGKTIELEPSQVTLPTGDSHFCCWHIEKSGSYTLQVFRPDNALSSFNFRIRKAVTSIPKSFLKK